MSNALILLDGQTRILATLNTKAKEMSKIETAKIRKRTNKGVITLSESAKRTFNGQSKTPIIIKKATVFDNFIKEFHKHSIVTDCNNCNKKKKCAKSNITPDSEAQYHCLECLQRSIYERSQDQPIHKEDDRIGQAKIIEEIGTKD